MNVSGSVVAKEGRGNAAAAVAPDGRGGRSSSAAALQHYYCVPVASGDAVYVQEIDVDSFANLGIDDSIDELWLLSFYSSRSVALSSYTLSLPIAPLSSALVPQQLRRVRGLCTHFRESGRPIFSEGHPRWPGQHCCAQRARAGRPLRYVSAAREPEPNGLCSRTVYIRGCWLFTGLFEEVPSVQLFGMALSGGSEYAPGHYVPVSRLQAVI